MTSDFPAPHTILIHGLGRSRHDMWLLARRLRRLIPETTVHVFDYHSRRIPLSAAVEQLNAFVGTHTRGEPVSFIGHSLGGIVARALDLRGDTAAPLKRLVTLGSPHQGALIARVLNPYRPIRAIFGPVLGDLGSLCLSETPNQLEIGCVVGALNSRWGFVPLFREDNDGLVLAREAMLATSADTIHRPIFHGLFPFSAQAAELSAAFLRTGRFPQ